MSNQTRQSFLDKIEKLETQFALEERRNPTPKNIVQLKHLLKMMLSDDWERSEYQIEFFHDNESHPVYEIDPETGEKYRYFDGNVWQLHKHKTSGITIERNFEFHHRENQPENILIKPDVAPTWQASELIIQDNEQVIFNGYNGDGFSSDNNLDSALKEHLTQQIIEAFSLSIDYNVMYQPIYHYIDESIKSDHDLYVQLELANDDKPQSAYKLHQVRAVDAGTEMGLARDFAFVGMRLAHYPNDTGKSGLYLSYGGFLVWLDDGDIFFEKNIDDLPVSFDEKIIRQVTKSMNALSEEQANNRDFF